MRKVFLMRYVWNVRRRLSLGISSAGVLLCGWSDFHVKEAAHVQIPDRLVFGQAANRRLPAHRFIDGNGKLDYSVAERSNHPARGTSGAHPSSELQHFWNYSSRNDRQRNNQIGTAHVLTT